LAPPGMKSFYAGDRRRCGKARNGCLLPPGQHPQKSHFKYIPSILPAERTPILFPEPPLGGSDLPVPRPHLVKRGKGGPPVPPCSIWCSLRRNSSACGPRTGSSSSAGMRRPLAAEQRKAFVPRETRLPRIPAGPPPRTVP
jgi:hypothetical protein